MKKSLKHHLSHWLHNRIPLGISFSNEVIACLLGLIGSSIYSIASFLFYYDYCLGGLYADAKRTRLLSPDTPYVFMPSFYEIADASLWGFIILITAMVYLIYYHYHYHFQGSKSIYLMQRLPEKNALLKRCVTLPILVIVITILTALLLWGIYYRVYMTCTPAQFL